MLTRNRSPKPARAPDRTSIRPQEHQKAGQYSPNHVDVNRKPQIVKVDKALILWWTGGTGHVPVGRRISLRDRG